MQTDLIHSTISRAIAVTILMFVSVYSVHAAEVKVGGYEFPPFVDENAPDGGLTLSVIEALNSLDSEYTFTFVSTSPKRRYEHMRKGRFDMMLFEMAIWGWEKEDIEYEATRVLLKGGEVYVAHVDKATSQSYFDWFGDKSLAGMLGYHYGFADFNADSEYLDENFDIELTTTHRGNLGKVLKKRIDVAVVTKSFLNLYFIENPGARDSLVLSDKLDQEYSLPALISGDSTISAADFTALLERLKASGKMDEVLQKFGLNQQWVF